MGRELQKKKNRSGVAKATQKPKSKKKILSHPIIAQSWDKSQTLAQNYKRLGLTAKLNKTTGGVEKKVSDVIRENDNEDRMDLHPDTLNITAASKRGKERIDLTEAKIERDPHTGKIVRVLDQPSVKSNPLNDPLNELDSDEEEEGKKEEELLNPHNQHGNVHPTHQTSGDATSKTDTVKALEEAARRPAAKYKRKQPEGEVQFIEELVAKYGDDYAKMARDIKINYMQRSEGDLKRRIKIWRDNGGTVGK